jgi:DNA-binding NarL/FixJ family response regulator
LAGPASAHLAAGLMAIRVVVGEANYLISEGITRLLESMEDVELLASTDDLNALRESVATLQPNIVLTDVRMPPTHTDEGIRFAAELRRSHPELGVVVLSQHMESASVMALFAEGSAGRGYLLEERLREPSSLRDALRTVAEGGSIVDSRVVEHLLLRGSPRDVQLDRLTPRERQTLAMIAEGRNNNAISEELKITKRAVEGYINAIYGKLDISDSGDVNRRVKAALVFLAAEPE